MTARRTRSAMSPDASLAKSSGPSRAMHAWWIRVFSSAYGSARRSPSRWRSGCAAAMLGSWLSS